MMCRMKPLYFLGFLIFGIHASYFENLDIFSYGLQSLLNSDEIAIPSYDKIEDLLTSFQPQNLQISNSSGTLHSDYQIGDIVRLKEDPQWTLLIQEFNEDKSGYVVADEGALKRYYVYATHLEKCPKCQIDEYNKVKKDKFPIVGKRFIFGGALYDVTNVSIENREMWIENVISGDSYQYRFDEQDKAVLLYKVPFSPAIKKFAQELQDNIDHSPIPTPTPTSTATTSRESVSVVSSKDITEEPWKNFEKNQLVLKGVSKKLYIFRTISKGKCRMVPLDFVITGSSYRCNDLRAVARYPEELKEWSRTGTVRIELEMIATPGDTLTVIRETPEILRSFILVSFSARKNGHCLLTDESGARYYVFKCRNLVPENYEFPSISSLMN